MDPNMGLELTTLRSRLEIKNQMLLTDWATQASPGSSILKKTRLVNLNECLNWWGFRHPVEVNTLGQCVKAGSGVSFLKCLSSPSPFSRSSFSFCTWDCSTFSHGVRGETLQVVWIWLPTKGSADIGAFSPANTNRNPLYHWGDRGNSSEQNR